MIVARRYSADGMFGYFHLRENGEEIICLCKGDYNLDLKEGKLVIEYTDIDTGERAKLMRSCTYANYKELQETIRTL